MIYLIDTSAWIEYLDGSAKGEKVNKSLNEAEIFTTSQVIAELVSKTKRKRGNVDTAYNAIIKIAKVSEVTPRIAKEAGILHAETKAKLQSFSLADALIICSARALKAKILTTDSHFKSFKEAIII